MTTLSDMVEALMAAEGLTRKPRELDELPEIRDPHRQVMAAIPTPQAPDDRL